MSYLEQFRRARDAQPSKRGRRRAFNSPEQLEILIEEYFAEIDERTVDVVTKNGVETMRDPAPPGIMGLCRALGIDPETLRNYEKRPEFRPVIARARRVIGAAIERRLYDRDGQRGAQFALTVHYGWSAPKEEEVQPIEAQAAPLDYAQVDREMAELRRMLSPPEELEETEGDEPPTQH